MSDSKQIKILTVLGARPQFIKAAAVSVAFKKALKFKEIIVHTGQHFDEKMSEIFFDELNIPEPEYNLGVGGGSHAYNTGRAMEGIENIISDLRPDGVLVYGDTDSTLAGSLASAKLNCPVFHVEAGLRSFNRKMPEEINRVLTDHISDLLFAPTDTAVSNLLREGIAKEKIKKVGDVMLDSTLLFGELSKIKSNILEKLCLGNRYALVTIHRKENVDCVENIKNIFTAIDQIGLTAVLPLHPRLRNFLKENSLELPKNLKVVDPVGYLDMISLIDGCEYVLTDSGGLQKEAYFRGKFCITLRKETEWVELVDEGVNLLAGVQVDEILKSVRSLKERNFKKLGESNLFGNGVASCYIVDEIEKYFLK